MSEPHGKDSHIPRPGGGGGSRSLRRHFLTGLLVVTPTVVAAWVLYRLFAFVDGLLWEDVRFGWVRPGGIPGVGAVTVLALVILVGILVNNYLGRRLYQTWEAVVTRIPLFSKIYIAVKQIGEALLSSEHTVFRAVGMIEYPRREIWSLVFLTEVPHGEVQDKTKRRVRSVFLPTTPNPTSGYLLLVPEEDILLLDMTVEDGLKMVISGGAYVPGDPILPAPREKRRRWFRRGSDEASGEVSGAAAPGEEREAPEDRRERSGRDAREEGQDRGEARGREGREPGSGEEPGRSGSAPA